VSEYLTAEDFFSGLFAALELQGWRKFSIRNERFDRALAFVFQKLTKESRNSGLKVGFRIQLHPIHGDSVTVRDAIAHAAQRDLISLDNPEFQDIQLKLDDTDARAILQSVPGKKALFFPLAREFAQHYSRPAPS
jgi:hypothetical protein